MRLGSEPKTGTVVIAVIANVALVVGLASICASQTEPCSYTGAGLSP
jgi:FlaG/FlaF family flagellin (archaellin)